VIKRFCAVRSIRWPMRSYSYRNSACSNIRFGQLYVWGDAYEMGVVAVGGREN